MVGTAAFKGELRREPGATGSSVLAFPLRFRPERIGHLALHAGLPKVIDVVAPCLSVENRATELFTVKFAPGRGQHAPLCFLFVAFEAWDGEVFPERVKRTVIARAGERKVVVLLELIPHRPRDNQFVTVS